MDGRKPPTSLRDLCGPTDADPAPTDSGPGDSSVIYFGNARQISEGFAIALRAMGVGADLLPADLAPRSTSSNRKEN
jgi:hypothetical protein